MGVARICLPVAMSIATVCLTLLTYMTPVVDERLPLLADLRSRADSAHTGTRRLTVLLLICLSGL